MRTRIVGCSGGEGSSSSRSVCLCGHIPKSMIVWAREQCRISPPRFLAECRKRRLNQGSFVCCILVCLLFLICIGFVYVYFPVLFCLSVSVK